jgi:hypothetical protein
MSAPPENHRLSDSPAQSLIESAARWIVSRRLETPALIFLEMNIPIVPLFHTALLAVEPIGAPLFGTERIAPLKDLLSERENIRELMREITALSESGDRAADPRSPAPH